eukprot:gnl/MRDRNA2_/MRDRNA2_74914_c0_seq1.p1 gnl/MRDRNA2_/MRDRNA2_74914_c0~~gnl/MRDRNA2_/MRDRNA2_74914_c0_seq1.p1  ORF type:complete len:892 (-),score=168.74 gnl/MRDRNA2_/MRDRNA2_74914_c0_seq1:142-2817(-)
MQNSGHSENKMNADGTRDRLTDCQREKRDYGSLQAVHGKERESFRISTYKLLLGVIILFMGACLIGHHVLGNRKAVSQKPKSQDAAQDSVPEPTSSPTQTFKPHPHKPMPTSSPRSIPKPTSSPDVAPRPTSSPSQHVHQDNQKALRGDKVPEISKSLHKVVGENVTIKDGQEKTYQAPGPDVFYTLHKGSLQASIVKSGKGLSWGLIAWEGGVHCTDRLELGPLFSMKVPSSSFASGECEMITWKPLKPNSDPAHGAGIDIEFSCPYAFHVTWSARMKEVTGKSGIALRTYVTVSGNAQVNSLAALLAKPGCVTPELMGRVDGNPIKAGAGRFLLALEHPLAKHSIAANDYGLQVAEITNLEQLSVLNAPLSYTAVILAVAEPDSQVRRTFSRYLQSIRPQEAWQGPMTHYNSWFDFASWQEGKWMDPKDQMCEAGALKRLKGFKALIQRGAKLDSFVLDDGWDDRHTVWEVDHHKFPRDLQPIAEEAKTLGAGLGIWLSPWGGYGNDKNDRLKASKAFGYETNDQGFTMSGPRYAARFREVMLNMRRVNHVNNFKIDGFQAQGEDDLALEVETLLRIMDDVRKDGGTVEDDGKGDSQPAKKKKDKKKPFWINLTTGTWPSPFFLLWVDSIWRGGGDLGVVAWPSVEGLSVRQRWQIYRECVVHENVVRQADLYPVSRLMVHGAVLGKHGESPYQGLDKSSPLDWAQEVWSLAALGLQLQELYISPPLMTADGWDELAEALVWSRAKAKILQDTHWVLPASCDAAKAGATTFQPYAAASWSPEAGEGFVFIRNPMSVQQIVPGFTLAKAFELSRSEMGSLHVKLVRRLPGKHLDEFLDSKLKCDGVALDVKELNPGVCAISSGAALTLEMTAGEVLVLQAWSPAKLMNNE